MSDPATGLKNDASPLDKYEKAGEKIGYLIVRMALLVMEIAVAFELVQIVEGGFQTIVVCALGIIYARIRTMSVESTISFYYSNYLTSFFSTRIALYSTTQTERSMKDKLDEMMAELEKFDPDPQRRLRHIEFWILNVIFVIPLLKLCLTHVLA